LGYRPLVDFNNSFICRVKENFYTEEYSVVVKQLLYYEEVIEFWNFMVEDIKIVTDLSYFYVFYYREMDRPIYDYLIEFLSFTHNFNCNVGCYKGHPDANVEGLNFRTLRDRSTILLNLIIVFMVENKIFVEGGLILQKDPQNFELEQKLADLENIFDLAPILIEFLVKRFPYQLGPAQIRLLILEYSGSVLAKIKAVPSLLPRRSHFSSLLKLEAS